MSTKNHVVFENCDQDGNVCNVVCMSVDTPKQRALVDEIMTDRGESKLKLIVGVVDGPESYWAGQWYYLNA